MNAPFCKYCGEEISWIKTGKWKKTPVNPVKFKIICRREEGHNVLREDGSLITNCKVGDEGYMPHSATCPDWGRK